MGNGRMPAHATERSVGSCCGEQEPTFFARVVNAVLHPPSSSAMPCQPAIVVGNRVEGNQSHHIPRSRQATQELYAGE